MKTDFVRQEDEEAKENEPRFRDVKKQEEELGRGRQDATPRHGTARHGMGNARREVITAVCSAFRSCVT